MTPKLYPVPLEFDKETRAIEHQGAPVAAVYDVTSFPCLDEGDEAQALADLDATGDRLVLAYNLFPDLEEFLARFVNVASYADFGTLLRYKTEAETLLRQMRPEPTAAPAAG